MSTTFRFRFLSFMIYALPFNGIHPILNIGELSSDGFFYFSIPFFLVGAFHFLNRPYFPRRYFWASMPLLCLIFASFMINAHSILGASHFQRSGLERFFSSLAVFCYFFVLFGFVAQLAIDAGRPAFLAHLSRYFKQLAIGLVAINAIEIVSWYNGPLRDLMTGVRSLLTRNTFFSEGRLFGFSYEPSFNAFVLIAAIPWLLWDFGQNRSLKNRLLIFAVIGISILSGARTAHIALLAMLFAHFTFLYTKGLRLPIAIYFIGLVFVAILSPIFVASNIDSQTSVSNVTRSYLITQSLLIVRDFPLGVGLGQAPFYILNMPSSDILYSWELISFFYGERIGEMPPLFSFYARSLAELGFLQFGLLLLLFVLFFSRNISSLYHMNDRAGAFLLLHTVSQLFVVAASIDSYRLWHFWVVFVLLCIVRIDTARFRASNIISFN